MYGRIMQGRSMTNLVAPKDWDLGDLSNKFFFFFFLSFFFFFLFLSLFKKGKGLLVVSRQNAAYHVSNNQSSNGQTPRTLSCKGRQGKGSANGRTQGDEGRGGVDAGLDNKKDGKKFKNLGAEYFSTVCVCGVCEREEGELFSGVR